MTTDRPDPDALLRRIAAAGPPQRGRLKVFFGAAPGVGKTYAMLEAARLRRGEGVAVVIGWVETHGRAETAALAEGFERLPGQTVAYRDVELHDFDLDLAPDRGTPWQRRVWEELCEIPYGETISYGELARRIGNPARSRAVGAANGRNPIAIVVPCHRVIGADGKLTGYGGGMERKRFLLDLERGQLTNAA